MNQRIRLTKLLLRNNLLEMLETQSVDKISIKELCDRAGINRSTFYAHYESVRDVLREIEDDITRQILVICQNKKLDTRKKLESICEYLYTQKRTELILFKNRSDGDLAGIFNLLDKELRPIRSMQGSSEDEILTLAFVNYGMLHLIKTWLQNDIDKTPKEIADLLIDHILRIN